MRQLTESDQSNCSKNEEVPNPIPEDKTINLTWPIRLKNGFKFVTYDPMRNLEGSTTSQTESRR